MTFRAVARLFLVSTLLGVPVILLPGYALGSLTGILGFRSLAPGDRLLCSALLGIGLLPWLPMWLALRVLIGMGMMCQYMVLESWLNEQAGPGEQDRDGQARPAEGSATAGDRDADQHCGDGGEGGDDHEVEHRPR